MPIYTHESGLFVAEQVSDSDAVERALNALDHPIAHRLFVTREVDRRYGCFVWRCMIDNGDQYAECLTEWRDDHGRPLPLSHGFVDKVRKQMAQGDADTLRKIAEGHKKIQDAVRREEDEAFEEIGRDIARRLSGGHSALLHRGVHLRRSREKNLRSGRDANRKSIGESLRRIA